MEDVVAAEEGARVPEGELGEGQGFVEDWLGDERKNDERSKRDFC